MVAARGLFLPGFIAEIVIIERYIFKEILQTFLAVTGILLVIYISNRFIRFLSEADAGTLAADAVLQLLLLKSVNAMVLILPLALYLAIMLALGRLYKDGEMTALAACGIGPTRLLKNILVLSVIFSAGVAAAAWYVAPWAEEKSSQLLDLAAAVAHLKGVAAGNFKEVNDGSLVFYIEGLSKDQSEMNNVFIHSEKDGKQGIISAPIARHRIDPKTGDRFVVLQDGYRYEGTPGHADFKIAQYKEHAIRVEEKAVVPSQRKLAAASTAVLRKSDVLADQAEIQWRMAMPIATVVLTLLAVPLSRTNPRQGRYGKLFAGILVYVIYSNLLGVGRAWLERGVTPAELGLWWVHGLFMIGVLFFIAQQSGIRWVIANMLRKATA